MLNSKSSPLKIRVFPEKISRKDVAPPIAVASFVLSLVVIGIVCLLIDRLVLPRLEDSGKVIASDWKADDQKINTYLWSKYLSVRSFPILRSLGIPVTVQRCKSKRILVMGDSFIYGAGAANINDLWWRQLQRELERRGYNDVEVIAAGWWGANTREELEWAKKILPLYRPDIVILGYVINDAAEPTEQNCIVKLLIPDGWHCARGKDSVNNNVKTIFGGVVPNLVDQQTSIRKDKLTARLVGTHAGYQNPEWNRQILKGENFRCYSQTVKELGKFIRQSKIPTFVLTTPSDFFEQPYYHFYADLYRPVDRLFRQNGILFVDILDEFSEQITAEDARTGDTSPFRFSINPANSHPGPFMCHIYAVQAANVLESRFPQTLGSKTEHASDKVAELAQKPSFNDWNPPWIQLSQLDPYSIQFRFPTSDAEMLQMPIRKPFVQLNLARPAALSRLELHGAALRSADIYVSSVDANLGFDDHSLHELGNKTGSDVDWTFPHQPWSDTVNTIRVVAKFNGGNTLLQLVLTPANSSTTLMRAGGTFQNTNGIYFRVPLESLKISPNSSRGVTIR